MNSEVFLFLSLCLCCSLLIRNSASNSIEAPAKHVISSDEGARNPPMAAMQLGISPLRSI